MATVYVNDKPVDIGSARLNCIQAAEKAGVLIPHYCWHEALTVVASCRMCLVELGDLKDGKVAMQPKVVPGCQTLVKDGAVIVTGITASARQPCSLWLIPMLQTRREGIGRPRRIHSRDCCSITRSIAPSATRPASASCKTIASSSAMHSPA